MSNGYNGYANYETWNIVLWMFNDEAKYLKMLKTIGEGKSNGKTMDKHFAATVARTVFDTHTPDRVRVDDERIDYGQVAAALAEA